jgi:hypothetical protein
VLDHDSSSDRTKKPLDEEPCHRRPSFDWPPTAVLMCGGSIVRNIGGNELLSRSATGTPAQRLITPLEARAARRTQVDAARQQGCHACDGRGPPVPTAELAPCAGAVKRAKHEVREVTRGGLVAAQRPACCRALTCSHRHVDHRTGHHGLT